MDLNEGGSWVVWGWGLISRLLLGGFGFDVGWACVGLTSQPTTTPPTPPAFHFARPVTMLIGLSGLVCISTLISTLMSLVLRMNPKVTITLDSSC